MKTKYLSAALGLLACLGVHASAQVVFNKLPAKAFGQAFVPNRFGEMMYPPSTAPNRTKAKGLYAPYSVAVDTGSSPAPVYVADTGNNRVLAWRDSASFTNGAPADLVLGQKDFDSAVPYGSAVRITESSTNVYDIQALKDYQGGLRSPSSLIYKGDFLFVMDAGNNRIVRFRRPFDALDAGESITPDLVIGQPDLKSNLPNQSSTANAAPSAYTIKTNLGSAGVQSAGIALDAEGNLWLADAGNHRILRYAAGDVFGSSNTGSDSAAIAANLVLGQVDFISAVANPGSFTSTRNDIMNKSAIRYGGPIAFDSVGNLYFADDLARVLVYGPPFSNGKAASRILGVYIATKGVDPPSNTNDLTFGFSLTGTTNANLTYTGGPRGLFCIDDMLYVVDTLNNRIVRYDPAGWWPPEDLANGVYSPHMSAVFGENDFNSRYPNTADFIEPNTRGFNYPVSGTYANGEVFITETGNHRVTVRPVDLSTHALGEATRELGQLDFPFKAPNFIEGSEFSTGTVPGTSITIGPSLTVDHVSETPHLYIADTANNRVLCFWDARSFNGASNADIVIGQVDHYRSMINSPYNDPANPNENGLYQPADVAVDAQGNLWVSDTGNGRVLRYPNPFSRTDGLQTPDLVLGAPDFTTKPATDISRDRMYLPVGLAFTPEGNLAVADLGLHRVLLFKQPSISGQPADTVFGQPDGNNATAGNLAEQLNSPRGIAIDSFGRLFVADTGNARVEVWDDINNAYGDGLPAQFTFPSTTVGVPLAVTIDRQSEAIWVADSSNLSRILRFPSYAQLLGTGTISADFGLQVSSPRRVALDTKGNPLVMDAASRVTMYYPRLSVANAANGFARVAPAMLGMVKIQGVTLAAEDAADTTVPMPLSVADVEVLVNGVTAPMKKVSGETATFLVPKGTPGGGTAEFLVCQVSTGQILGFDRITMSPISPGIMYQGDTIFTQGPAKAKNQDGSDNSASSPAKIDQELTVFLTGYGNFDGLPEDGTAPGGETPVPGDVRVFLLSSTNAAVEAQFVSSTLDPDVPGQWRVKFKVPTTLSAGTYTVNMLYKSTSTLIPPGYSTIQVRPLVSITR